jgi:hypothetical protein
MVEVYHCWRSSPDTNGTCRLTAASKNSQMLIGPFVNRDRDHC